MQRLTKGLEEEVYTGEANGRIVGLAHRIASELDQFVTEPDARNVEFATQPYREYEQVCQELIQLRGQLRAFLATLGPYTLIPGGTLSLFDDGTFTRSDPDNAYHGWIEANYGTRVVTASTHLNVGVDDPEALLRAWRVIRMDAPIFLALTAASPFLNGEVTGLHSTRWHRFPKTPEVVPFFAGQAEYGAWIEAHLADQSMRNIRHLWLAARPNGEAAPWDLNRIELRICDRISDPRLLLAVTALLEGRVLQALEDPAFDPLRFADGDTLLRWSAGNEDAVSAKSLSGRMQPWDGGAPVAVDRAVERLLEEVRPFAQAHEFRTCLGPVEAVLDRGNVAQEWLSQIEAGRTIEDILRDGVAEMEEQEKGFLVRCGCPS